MTHFFTPWYCNKYWLYLYNMHIAVNYRAYLFMDVHQVYTAELEIFLILKVQLWYHILKVNFCVLWSEGEGGSTSHSYLEICRDTAALNCHFFSFLKIIFFIFTNLNIPVSNLNIPVTNLNIRVTNLNIQVSKKIKIKNSFQKYFFYFC